ncbi:MAG: hypothetical protein MUE81_19170 [Thermoflexibacter sp.]|jgi:uncharacterized protein YkuJ|nr:hypothetical protein [Thermoflexibacter sp.]
MNFLKEFFLKWKIKQALVAQKGMSQRQTPNYDEAKSIGILLYTQNINMTKSIQKLLHTFEKDGKKVTVLAYFPDKENHLEFNFQHFVLTEQEITNWGEIKSEIVETFIHQPFDYLYCISKESSLVFKYILAKSKAKCRVGKYEKSEAAFFELMIDLKTEQDIDFFVQQALHYTQSIIYN